MRKIGQVALYFTALCAAAVAASYMSLLLSPNLGMSSGEDGVTRGERAEEVPSPQRRSDVGANREVRVPTPQFADQIYRSGRGALAGLLVFIAVHAIGFARMKGGVSQLFAEPDAEDLMPGLRIYGVAVLAGALLGGLLGRAFG